MKRVVLLAVVLATLPAAAAQQSELGGKVRSGQEVTIPATETVQGDLIASGGTVRVDGRVDGDLVASGGRVVVAGVAVVVLLSAIPVAGGVLEALVVLLGLGALLLAARPARRRLAQPAG